MECTLGTALSSLLVFLRCLTRAQKNKVALLLGRFQNAQTSLEGRRAKAGMRRRKGREARREIKRKGRERKREGRRRKGEKRKRSKGRERKEKEKDKLE